MCISNFIADLVNMQKNMNIVIDRLWLLLIFSTTSRETSIFFKTPEDILRILLKINYYLWNKYIYPKTPPGNSDYDSLQLLRERMHDLYVVFKISAVFYK